MWRFLSACEPAFIYSPKAKAFPSRNSCLKRLASGLDLHCLTITTCSNSRPYTNLSRAGTASTCRDPADLALSDSQRKTIYALSTPPGKAGIGVVRVSGPDAMEVWRNVVRTAKGHPMHMPRPWTMERCRVVHPQSGEVIDDGLAVFFKAPNSFTTEDVLELHVHSGRAILSSVFKALSSLPFCRPAEAGEFTRRAFKGGRLDLTQVEGLKDLIDAETEGQRKIALRAARGATRIQFEELRSDIIHCLAMVEALIDFGEGEDIEEGVYAKAQERATELHRTIESYVSDSRRGEILRSGIRLAIFGPPNAGKSSLLNFLAQRDAAIVTPVPGTTRDILELSLDIGGLPMLVADTAGLRVTDDPVESIGVERAKNAVEEADISLCVLSLPEILVSTPEGPTIKVPESVLPLMSSTTYFLFNKLDLVLPPLPNVSSANSWTVSLSTGEGMDNFLDQFTGALQTRFDLLEDINSSREPLITHARHRVHLESALRFIEAFLATPANDVVLGAEELRYAAQAVGKISGLIDVEDVLDAIFRNFCIGK